MPDYKIKSKRSNYRPVHALIPVHFFSTFALSHSPLHDYIHRHNTHTCIDAERHWARTASIYKKPPTREDRHKSRAGQLGLLAPRVRQSESRKRDRENCRRTVCVFHLRERREKSRSTARSFSGVRESPRDRSFWTYIVISVIAPACTLSSSLSLLAEKIDRRRMVVEEKGRRKRRADGHLLRETRRGGRVGA